MTGLAIREETPEDFPAVREVNERAFGRAAEARLVDVLRTANKAYDQVIPLDAEDLAEGGISRAYKSLLPKLSQYVSQPAEIEEVLDDRQPSYAVRYRDREYRIYSPEGQQDESWGRAAYALFSIVNDQLEGSSYRLYAIGGGNDLGGIFLTPSECEAARKSSPRKMDWPYLPTLDDSWYGQYHD
jgi:hypothetical protein